MNALDHDPLLQPRTQRLGFPTEARVIMYCKWEENSVVVSRSISSSKYLFAIS